MAYPPPPYADAVCGGFVAGEALAGTWWAYPPQGGLKLGASPPTVVIAQGATVPAAGLRLGATAPGLVTGLVVSPPQAGLRLGGTLAALSISSRASPSGAGLAYGASPVVFVGQEYALPLTPADCIEIEMEAVVCR